MDANDQSEFSKLTLAEQYDRLAKLRAIAIVAALGDDELLDRMIGGIVDQSPQALPDAAGIADEVDAWLAGGAQ